MIPVSSHAIINTPKMALLDQDEVFHFIIERSLPFWGPIFDSRLKSFTSVEKIVAYLLKHSDHIDKLPDVILFDVYMSPLDGWVFLDLYEKTKDVLIKKPIICLVSNSISPTDKERAASYESVSLYIEKPITKTDFDQITDLWISIKCQQLEQ
jgi:CheY-like chemotaxis protein